MLESGSIRRRRGVQVHQCPCDERELAREDDPMLRTERQLAQQQPCECAAAGRLLAPFLEELLEGVAEALLSTRITRARSSR